MYSTAGGNQARSDTRTEFKISQRSLQEGVKLVAQLTVLYFSVHDQLRGHSSAGQKDERGQSLQTSFVTMISFTPREHTARPVLPKAPGVLKYATS